MDPWDAFPDDWDAFPDAPGDEQPRAPKASPAVPQASGSPAPARPSGAMPTPDLPTQAKRLGDALRNGASQQGASPPRVPKVDILPGDYRLGMDGLLDFSPPSSAMTNIQQRQYLQMVNDHRVDRRQLTGFLEGFGRTVDDATWQSIEAGRRSGVPFGAVASGDERFAGMVDQDALAAEYAPESDGVFAQIGRSMVEGWSDPASLMNALDRGKLDFFNVYEDRLRQQFPNATPEQIARLEDEYIGYMARMRSKAASEGVKGDSFAPWLIGQFLAVEPYDVVPVGRAAKAATRAGRVLEKAGEGAAVAVSGDLTGQALAIRDGAQDNLDLRRTAGSAILSGLLAGGVEGLSRGPAVSPEAMPDAAPVVDDAPPVDPLVQRARSLGQSLIAANDGGAVPRARPLMSPNTRAELLASASRVQPRDMLPIPANTVDAADAANINRGRFAEAKPMNERGALLRGTVTNWRGEQVPKVGPLDMVGWLRTQGGLREQGGELATMGLTNAARRGLDHVGQETRFGPLVDPEGMNLDDAALAAWEAGYFAELAERPDINTFLDALRDTYDGGAGRRFLAEDMAQVEAFDAMRAERYDLERAAAENGGPLYVDRSVPAEERPFPPVEAYEEWPAEAVARVGNLDVSKLDTPQDIGRALRQSYNTLGGFDDATRGRITQAETERLAAELNMTPDQLLSRRKGQAFNAEEALAARQILAKSANELVNAARRISRLDDPGDELLAEFRQKWMRHVAIQEQVAGATAEAGRVLQQFRMAADSRAVRGDVLSAFVRGGGGKDDLQEAANALLDAVEMGPGVFNTLAEQVAKPKFRDKIAELYINSLLSNPPTHIVNMVSSSISAVGQIPEYALGSAIGGARRALLGAQTGERILASEVGARTFGLVQGMREGVSLFAKALRTGEADDFASKVEGDQYRAISGLKGEVVRLPTRFLTAEDQFFKGIARRMELNAQAVRIANRKGLKGAERKARVAELSANPTDEMLERALEYGRYLTFQRKMGAFGQGLTRITSDSLAAKVVVPFVRTPINLLKFATERSPAAPLLKEWREDLRAGGERRDMAVARALVGSGFGALFYQMALDGQITGAVPPDPAKAKLLYADGWQPYSIKVGDRYVSYSRLDPIATTLGVAADMATLPEGMSDRQKDDQSTMLVASIMNSLASKTWLSGVSSLVEGLSDPQRNAENWLERTLSSFAVPAIVAGAARQIDPVARQRNGVLEAVQARIPGLSDNLMPRRDVFGEPVPIDSVGPDFLSPFSQTIARNDPVVAEMQRIGKSVSAPGKQYTQDGERLDYTPEQYDRYHEIAGRLTYNRLLGLIGSEAYSKMSDPAKRKAAEKAIASARKSARALLNDPAYPLSARGAVDAGNDPWADFPDDGAAPRPRASQAAPSDAWDGFPDAEQRDVLGTLQRAIPGVSITSGYRTREYQADMRRRGYKPADNSAHLDGSALDLVPPRGMTLGQLMQRVRGIHPVKAAA